MACVIKGFLPKRHSGQRSDKDKDRLLYIEQAPCQCLQFQLKQVVLKEQSLLLEMGTNIAKINFLNCPDTKLCIFF